MIVLGSCSSCEVRLDGEASAISSVTQTLFSAENLDPSTLHHLRITKRGTRASRLLVSEVRVAFL